MSGYEADMFERSPDPDLICPICQCVLHKPVESPCRHVFCQVCIETWLNKRNTCPACREDTSIESLKPVLPLIQNMINRLAMKCPNCGNGCTQSVVLESYEAHVKVCGYEKLLCSSPRCGEMWLRRELSDHEKGCEYRQVQCQQRCRLMIAIKDRPFHCCMDALLNKVKEQQDQLERLREREQSLIEMKADLHKQLDEVHRRYEAARSANVITFVYSDNDDDDDEDDDVDDANNNDDAYSAHNSSASSSVEFSHDGGRGDGAVGGPENDGSDQEGSEDARDHQYNMPWPPPEDASLRVILSESLIEDNHAEAHHHVEEEAAQSPMVEDHQGPSDAESSDQQSSPDRYSNRSAQNSESDHNSNNDRSPVQSESNSSSDSVSDDSSERNYSEGPNEQGHSDDNNEDDNNDNNSWRSYHSSTSCSSSSSSDNDNNNDNSNSSLHQEQTPSSPDSPNHDSSNEGGWVSSGSQSEAREVGQSDIPEYDSSSDENRDSDSTDQTERTESSEVAASPRNGSPMATGNPQNVTAYRMEVQHGPFTVVQSTNGRFSYKRKLSDDFASNSSNLPAPPKKANTLNTSVLSTSSSPAVSTRFLSAAAGSANSSIMSPTQVVSHYRPLMSQAPLQVNINVNVEMNRSPVRSNNQTSAANGSAPRTVINQTNATSGSVPRTANQTVGSRRSILGFLANRDKRTTQAAAHSQSDRRHVTLQQGTTTTNIYNTNDTSSLTQNTARKDTAFNIAECSDTDTSYKAESDSDDVSISEEDDTDEPHTDYEVEVPKSTLQLLGEYASDSD